MNAEQWEVYEEMGHLDRSARAARERATAADARGDRESYLRWIRVYDKAIAAKLALGRLPLWRS